MAVDETGRDGSAFGIDGDIGSRNVDILFSANSKNAISDGDDGVGVKDGVGKVSAEQKADIADDQLSLWRRFRRFLVSHGSLPGAELLRSQWPLVYK